MFYEQALYRGGLGLESRQGCSAALIITLILCRCNDLKQENIPIREG
jgi:hypothetical protein